MVLGSSVLYQLEEDVKGFRLIALGVELRVQAWGLESRAAASIKPLCGYLVVFWTREP